MKDNDRFQTTYNIAWQKNMIDGSIYILDYSANEFTLYNDVAKEIWNCIIQGLTVKEITEFIMENYEGATSKEVRNDVEDFIVENMNKGFLEYVSK